jgi:Fic family protein
MQTYDHIAFKRRWTITPQCQFQLGECSAMVQALIDTPLLPEVQKKMLNVSLVKGAQATTAIEGNTLSEEQITLIQEGGKLPPSKEYLELEVRNILDAFNSILHQVVRENKDALIGPDLLLQFHKMIGQGLGTAFDAVPGQFRNDSRYVGPYRAPDHEAAKVMVKQLCTWLYEEFHYTRGQDFPTAVIQAIVAHVYIEWIHPFADGNGRTGRLVEFYILLRSGLPSIVSHILSNFYNITRHEYYRQLDSARKKNDLSEFISYAVQGFRDGLAESLQTVQEGQLLVFWQYYVHTVMTGVTYTKKDSFKRKRELILQFPLGRECTANEIALLTPETATLYASVTKATLARDLDDLQQLKLLVKSGRKYKANIDILKTYTPERKL